MNLLEEYNIFIYKKNENIFAQNNIYYLRYGSSPSKDGSRSSR